MDACNLRRNHIESNPDTKVESVNKESLPEWGAILLTIELDKTNIYTKRDEHNRF